MIAILGSISAESNVKQVENTKIFLATCDKNSKVRLNALNEDKLKYQLPQIVKLSHYFFQKTMQIHAWIKYVVMSLLSFNIVQNSVHRLFKCDSILLGTLINNF